MEWEFGYIRKYLFLPVVLFIEVIILWILVPGQFFSIDIWENMLFQVPEICMIALALMVTFYIGEINLSAVSIATFSGVLGAKLFLSHAYLHDSIPITIAGIVFILFFSTMLGLLNGAIVAYFEIPSILVTIGATIAYEGIMRHMTNGGSISNFSSAFYSLGNDSIIGLPVPLIILIGAIGLILYIFKSTNLGRKIKLVGMDATAAQYSGINIKKIQIFTYGLSGLMSGLAAIIISARYNSISLSYGTSYLLLGLVAVALAGIKLEGGSVKIQSLLLAIAVLHILSTGLNLFGISRYFMDVIMGTMVLLRLTLKLKRPLIQK